MTPIKIKSEPLSRDTKPKKYVCAKKNLKKQTFLLNTLCVHTIVQKIGGGGLVLPLLHIAPGWGKWKLYTPVAVIF